MGQHCTKDCLKDHKNCEQASPDSYSPLTFVKVKAVDERKIEVELKRLESQVTELLKQFRNNLIEKKLF